MNSEHELQVLTTSESAVEPSPSEARPRRRRTYKKRTRFQVPRPVVAVRALWEQATPAEQERAHKTCALMIEHWLGKRSKDEMVKELGLPPLRVWQLSQSALSGMLAGLLRQPKMRKRKHERTPEDNELNELRKENARLKNELKLERQMREILSCLPGVKPIKGPKPATPETSKADASPTGEKKRKSRESKPTASEHPNEAP